MKLQITSYDNTGLVFEQIPVLVELVCEYPHEWNELSDDFISSYGLECTLPLKFAPFGIRSGFELFTH